MKESTSTAAFFEQKYRDNADPWNFAHSEYEQARYDAIMEALGARAFDRALEPGCSVGELTWRLAKRCSCVEAIDISATAIDHAKVRCGGLDNVNLRVGGLPETVSGGVFDLIVFSEIGYYFDERNLEELGNVLVHMLSGTGVLIGAHWLGSSQDHLLSGDRVHQIIGGLDGLRLEHSERHEAFRLDRWVRR